MHAIAFAIIYLAQEVAMGFRRLAPGPKQLGVLILDGAIDLIALSGFVYYTIMGA